MDWDARFRSHRDKEYGLSNIHKASELRSDRLEQIGNRKSLAYESLLKCGNLDAANLDLCDSVARCDAGTSDTALEAILEIVRFQSECRSEPWLLFLTTRADRATVNQTVLSKLLEIVDKNLRQNAGFKDCAARTAVLIENEIATEIGGAVTLDPLSFTRVFGIGLSKWLLQISIEAWKVKQTISACYRVLPDAHNPDMLSLAFRFERQPIPVTDPTGIVRGRRGRIERQPVSEATLAVEILKRTEHWVDVDMKLHEDANLRETMIVENAEVMAEARFDREDIIAWGRANCWQPPAN